MLRFMQGLLLSIMVSMVHSHLLGWVAAAEATGRRLVRHAGHALEASEVCWWLLVSIGELFPEERQINPQPPNRV